MKGTKKLFLMMLCVVVATCSLAMVSCGNNEDDMFEKPIIITYMNDDVFYNVVTYYSVSDAAFPEPPKKTNYTFSGWVKRSIENGQTVETAFVLRDFLKSKARADCTVYAKFIPNGLVLSYNTNGGDKLDDSVGTTFNEVLTPKKADFSFCGWYSDEDLKSRVRFPLEISANTTIYAKWIQATDGFRFNYTNNQYHLAKYSGSDVVVVVPSTFDSLPVTAIGASAFESLKVTQVTMPSTTISIGESAFSDTKLTSVIIPSGVTSIGKSAFSGTKLTSVIIPSGVTSIEDRVFNYCDELASVTLAEGSIIDKIGERAFYKCGKLKAINIPKTVKSIGSSAFLTCLLLETVTFEEGSVLEIISFNAFEDCKALISMQLPQSLAVIDSGAFANCFSLTTINIPSKIETINSYTFSACKSLTSVTFESNSMLTKISSHAFAECILLDNVTIPAQVTLIAKNVFLNCSALTSVTFSNTANWFIADSLNGEKTEIVVTDSAKNATSFKVDYLAKIWVQQTPELKI